MAGSVVGAFAFSGGLTGWGRDPNVDEFERKVLFQEKVMNSIDIGFRGVKGLDLVWNTSLVGNG